MALNNEFIYTITANTEQLKNEIINSDITIALDNIIIVNNDVIIKFKASLSSDEINILNNIVNSHVPNFDEQSEKIKLDVPTESDGALVIYPTKMKQGYYTCFQGSGDTESEIGLGEMIIFYLTSRDKEITKIGSFNEDIYLKDGFMIVKDAPFGANLDISLLDPNNNHILYFARKIPIFGTGWFPLNAEGTAFLPKDFKIKITVRNSNGGIGENEDIEQEYPANFRVAGRLELHRKKPY